MGISKRQLSDRIEAVHNRLAAIEDMFQDILKDDMKRWLLRDRFASLARLSGHLFYDTDKMYIMGLLARLMEHTNLPHKCPECQQETPRKKEGQ